MKDVLLIALAVMASITAIQLINLRLNNPDGRRQIREKAAELEADTFIGELNGTVQFGKIPESASPARTVIHPRANAIATPGNAPGWLKELNDQADMAMDKVNEQFRAARLAIRP